MFNFAFKIEQPKTNVRSSNRLRSPPEIDRISFEGSSGGEEDEPIFLSRFPAKAHYKMMEENRDDNPSELVARAQPRSTAKGSK